MVNLFSQETELVVNHHYGQVTENVCFSVHIIRP